MVETEQIEAERVETPRPVRHRGKANRRLSRKALANLKAAGITFNCECLQCGHKWMTLLISPRVCPSCHTMRWKAAAPAAIPPEVKGEVATIATIPGAEVAEIIGEPLKAVIGTESVISPAVTIIPETPPAEVKTPVSTWRRLVSMFHKAKKAPAAPKKLATRRWWLAGIGLLSLALGVWLGAYFLEHPKDIFVGLGSFGSFGVAAYLIYGGVKRRDGGLILKGAGVYTSKENTINICVKWDAGKGRYKPDRIEFIEVKDPKGTYTEITNLNKWFYINDVRLQADGTIESKPWELPDGEYLSPRKYTIPLIMKSNERYEKFLRSSSLFKKVSVGLMVLAFAVMTVFFFATVSG